MGRKSAKIALRKGAADKARSQVYAKTLKEVFLASKKGGAGVGTNFLLKVAVERCKKFNVPRDLIDKAIKKGQGTDGVGYEEVSYEGYGPHGVAIFVETSTNNPTRTVANVKSYFNKHDGSVGVTGSLKFLFERKAVFEIPLEGINEEEFTLHMIDAGAEDVQLDEGFYVVTAGMESFGAIQEKLQAISITPEEASLVRIPTTKKKLDEASAGEVYELIDMIEEDDDVITVYHNMEE
jgi:YebC/PmpR family DNA-binding regulatory protein